MNRPFKVCLDTLLLTGLGAFFICFELFSGDFAKAGINLNFLAGFGVIPNMKPKLFPMEMLIAILSLLVFFARNHLQKISNSGLLKAMIFLLCLGFLRLGFDLWSNPILAIRNSAFSWYLLFPLLLAAYPISPKQLETLLAWVLTIFSAVLAQRLLYYFLFNAMVANGEPIGGLMPDIGVAYLLAHGMYTPQGSHAALSLAILGFLLGFSVFAKIQRTYLIGLIVVAALMLLFQAKKRGLQIPWPRIFFFVAMIGLGFLGMAGALVYHLGSTSAALQQFRSTQSIYAFERVGLDVNEAGARVSANAPAPEPKFSTALPIDAFRHFMWQDAFGEFLSSPLVGIGFVQPVVKRVYWNRGHFMPNSGSYEKYANEYNFGKESSPPLAGPHNSYLNALARLGILGGLGFALLHALAFFRLVKHEYWTAAILLVSQMIYAFFNIGLEGPIHSFGLLICLAIAIKLPAE